MISSLEQSFIYQHAYIPEHLSHYVQAVTQAEAFFIQGCLVYVREAHLSLVAYPITTDPSFRDSELEESWLLELLSDLQQAYEPQVISVISPIRLDGLRGWELVGEDQYYQLQIDQVKPDKKIRNLIQRAERECIVESDQTFDCRYKKLVNEFLKTHRVSAETRSIFKRLPRISKNPGCVLISAFNQHRKLVAFDIFDFSAAHTGFYLFNFYSRRHYVPGASDLLLSHGIQLAHQQGKKFLNLGLGIHPGIEMFKQKWGSQPFMRYYAYQKEPEIDQAEDVLFGKL